MAFSLQEALQQLRSDKLRERQSGLDTLEIIFAAPDAVHQLDARRDGKAWLKTFQALFSCILSEKLGCVKKGGWADAQPASLARLRRAAQILRSLVEKSAALLPQRVIKALVVHIVQMMQYRGALFEPVASAYIPALVAILQHPHHVEHLDEQDWTATVTLCFNTLLAKDLSTDLSDNTGVPTTSQISSGFTSQIPKALSLEDACLADCLQHLLASGNAPLLGSEGYGSKILDQYTEFLLLYQQESSAHPPILRGLLHLVQELELNSTQDVITSALASKKTILSLWSTKNKPLKIRVLLYLRTVVPLLISCTRPTFELFQDLNTSTTDVIKVEAQAYIEAAHSLIFLDVSSRWGFEPLSIDGLILRSSNQSRGGIFSNDFFESGDLFTERDSVAWTRLDLDVEILLHLLSSANSGKEDYIVTADFSRSSNHVEEIYDVPSKRLGGRITERSSKRSSANPAFITDPHINEHLDALVTKARSTVFDTSARLTYVQTIVFLIVQSWPSLTTSTSAYLIDAIVSMLSDASEEVSAWNMVCLACIVSQEQQAFFETHSAAFSQAWSLATRKLSTPSSVRAGAYLMNAMLQKHAVPAGKALTDLDWMIKELDVHGPALLCDSVCHLLVTAQTVCTSQVAFRHLQPRRKICDWIMSNIKLASIAPLTASHGHYTPLRDIFRLICATVSSGGAASRDWGLINSVPQDEVSSFCAQRQQLDTLRSLALRADSDEDDSRLCHTDSFSTTLMDDKPTIVHFEEHRRIGGWVQKHIDASLSSPQEESVTHMMIMLQLAFAGISVAAITPENMTRLAKSSCELLHKTLAQAQNLPPAHTVDKATIFQQLSVLDPSLHLQDDNQSCLPNLLHSSGPSSGIVGPHRQLTDSEQKSQEKASNDYWSAPLKLMQSTDYLQPILDNLTAYLCSTLRSVEIDSSYFNSGQPSDEFDDDEASREVSNILGMSSRERLSGRSQQICLRILPRLLIGAQAQTLSRDSPVTNPALIRALRDCSTSCFVSLAPTLLNLFAQQRLYMEPQDVLDVLERIGVDVLGSYYFARDSTARLAAISSLQHLLPRVIALQEADPDLADKMSQLTSFFARHIHKSEYRSTWDLRVACLRYLSVCVTQDPQNLLQADGSPALTKIILKMNSDVDMRVRAHASSESASLFEQEGASATSLYESFRDRLPTDSENPQRILSRALALSNVAICNCVVRRPALFHLLEIVLATGTLPTIIRRLLAVIARKLNFKDAISLFDEFASQITWGMITNSYDPLQLPWQVLGFESKRACFVHNFQACGSMLLAGQTEHGKTQFQTLVCLTRRDLSQSLQQCLPYLAATQIAFSAQAAADQVEKDGVKARDDIAQTALNGLISFGFSNADNALIDELASVSDSVVVAILSQFYSPGDYATSACPTTVASIRTRDSKCAATLERLSPSASSSKVHLHEPSRPFFAPSVVYDSLLCLEGLGIDAFQSDVVYNVIQDSFARISSSHFINDQIRLFGALRLYLAMSDNAIWKDQLIVKAILRSIIDLRDLQHLREDLKCLTKEVARAGSRVTGLSESIAECLLKWASSKSSGCLTDESSKDNDSWLLEIAHSLGRNTTSISSVVLLWPRNLADSELVSAEEMLTIDSIAIALVSLRNATFTHVSLARLTAILAKASKREVATFYRKYGRRFTEWISKSTDLLSDEVSTGLISDLFAAACDYQSEYTLSEPWDELEARQKQRIRTSVCPSMTWYTNQAALMAFVLSLAHRPALSESYGALKCLRGMTRHLSSGNALRHIRLPAEMKAELSRLRFSPAIEKLATTSTTEDLASQELRDASLDFEIWIRKLDSIMCDLLAAEPEAKSFLWMRGLVAYDVEAAKNLFADILVCFTPMDQDSEIGGAFPTLDESSEGAQSQLKQCRDLIGKHFVEVLSSSRSDPRCWESIIQASLSMREWTSSKGSTGVNTSWLDIGSQLLARRCLDCHLYTASVFFIEHDEEQQTKPETVALLHDAYANVCDPDAFYGITQGHVQDLLVKRLHHEGQWQRALEYHAADFEAHREKSAFSKAAAAGVGQALTRLGFSRLSNSLSSTVGFLNSESDAHWNGSTWDLAAHTSSALLSNVSAEQILTMLRRSSSEEIHKPLKSAFASTIRSLGSTSVERVSDYQKAQGNLLVLRQVRDWNDLAAQQGLEEAVAHFQTGWTRHGLPPNFALSEAVLTARQSIAQAARLKNQTGAIGDGVSTIAKNSADLERAVLVALSTLARSYGKLQTATNATARAQMLERELRDKANVAQEEFARVLWERQEHSPAIQLLTQICDGLEVDVTSDVGLRRRKAKQLVTLAEWRTTARSLHPREIDKQLFEPALMLTRDASKSEDSDLLAEQSEVAYKWARFAEQHFRSSNVDEIARLEMYIERRQAEIAQNQQESDRATSRTEKNQLLQFQRQAEKILRQDQSHLKDFQLSRSLFLRRSVVMYARSLSTCDQFPDAVARLVSLWFEFDSDAELNRLLATCLGSIPSRKFLNLMHQLSARLSDDQTGVFQLNLSSLLLRMCKDHPFHTMYAVFALIKTGADTSSTQRSLNSQALAPQILRSKAAERIWNDVKKDVSMSKRIRIFEEVCIAYVEWAEYDLTSRADRYYQANGHIKKGSLRTPPQGELKLARLRNIDVPIATVELQVDHTCKYSSFVSISRYSDVFSTAGGIHLPKIIECVGSDGRRYKQLFKRDDDLRQDAVMQQVFRLVNDLLAQDRRTRERRLLVRTYSVIPLGPQCGLLEFVVNTTPLGEILVNMHTTYRPGDYTPAQARSKLRDSHTLPASEKLEVFLDVCEHMQPAMRYFFTETQRSPRHWFGTRLNYTRSVATSSIVGHLLGLGDRHVSNILLDKQSGELVHIDFGVAFDQGRLLPIPELVPFRLTRDLVDGMGMNGVEGTFRRCCEETLRVLRANQDVIRTVLEVFKYDPLFAWTSNPIKVLRAQEDETDSIAGTASLSRSGSTHAALPPSTGARGAHRRAAADMDTAELSADRAITSVMTKLSSTLSIEYTVNDLIQQAMDANNLASIFHGWQAAL